MIRLVLVGCLLVSASAVAAEQVPAFVKPYPGQKLYGDVQTAAFDELVVLAGKSKGDPTGKEFKKLQGKVTQLHFDMPEGRSTLEVYTNYEQALLKAGFQKAFACAGTECGSTVAPMPTWNPPQTQFVPTRELRYLLAKLERPTEGDVWVALYVNDVGLPLTAIKMVEEKPMQTGMVTIDASALKDALERTGHVAVYGIVFDTGKATLKPESKPAFEEIKKLLDSHPSLKIYVVGHTDDVGDQSANLTLSNARAAAVVKELTTIWKIAPSRLKSAGVGPYVPVASNRNEEGRARNRRVELVEGH